MTTHEMQIDRNYPWGGENQGPPAAEGQKEQSVQSGQESQQQVQGQQQDRGQEQTTSTTSAQPTQEQPAQGQGQQAQVQEQGQSSQEQQQQQQVTPEIGRAFQAMRQEIQDLKNQVSYQQQQAQQPSNQQGQQQQQQQDPFSDYDDEDMITVADMKKMVNQIQQNQGPPQGQQGPPQGQQQYQPDVRELQMQVNYSDYTETIQNGLSQILQNNPHLESAIRNSENPYMTAYSLVKQFNPNPQGQGGQPAGQQGQQQGQQAQRIVNNLQKPGSASQVSGGSPVGQANYYANISDNDLENEIAKAKRG